MGDHCKNLYAELQEYAKAGVDVDVALKIMEISCLERIADATEKMQMSLSELEPLADLTDCVSKTGGGDLFCIAGNVTGYNG